MPTLPPQPPTRDKHFTPFRSAAEEAAMSAGEDEWNNEGGHMSSSAGRIVHAPGDEMPYKVILSCPGRAETERAFATMRQAEAFIRRNTPIPAQRRTLYDRPADAGPSSTSNREARS